MKKTLNQLTTLLEENNISLPQGVDISDAGEQIEEYERCLSLKAGLTSSKAYLIDPGASNHMVSSRESFTTLNLIGGPIIYMVDESQIPTIGRVSIKIQHTEFKNVLYVPSLTTHLLSIYQMTHIGSPNQVVFVPD